MAACLQWLLGRNYEGGVLKEAAYGRNYQGSTAAFKYIDYCAAQGVTLAMMECGTLTNAIARAHELLAQNIPVIFTQQDDYCSLQFRALWTHVCTFVADTSDTLTAMDTFIAQNITYSDAVWETRLRSSQLWTLALTQQKEEDMIPSISLKDAVVASYFQADGSQWLCKQTGKHLGNDMLTFYQLYGSGALCGLTYLGLPLTDEVSIGSGRTMQFFERGVLCYDPSHSNDAPPGAGAVYPMHLYSGKGQDPRLATAQKQVNTLQTQLDAAQKQLASVPSPDVQLQSQVQQLQGRLTDIETAAVKLVELAKI